MSIITGAVGRDDRGTQRSRRRMGRQRCEYDVRLLRPEVPLPRGRAGRNDSGAARSSRAVFRAVARAAGRERIICIPAGRRGGWTAGYPSRSTLPGEPRGPKRAWVAPRSTLEPQRNPQATIYSPVLERGGSRCRLDHGREAAATPAKLLTLQIASDPESKYLGGHRLGIAAPESRPMTRDF